MKKLIAAFLALCMMMTACAALATGFQNDWSVLPDDDETGETSVMMDYTATVEQYADALATKADGYMDDEYAATLPDSVRMALDAAEVGFVLKDLDGDGHAELIVMAKDPDNAFLNNMVLTVLTHDGTEGHVVLESAERSRYYYAGDNLFAYEGSNGADDSTVTTYALENGQLTDLHTETPDTAYQSMETESLMPTQE